MAILATVLLDLLRARQGSGHAGMNWGGLLVASMLMGIYVFGFSGSIVVLRYSHAGGARRWLQEHGNQLFLVVIGVALKYLFDWLLLLWRAHHP